MTEQLEMFPSETFVEMIDRRLPASDILCVTDVAVACRVSVHKVYEWIQSGEISAVNTSFGSRPTYDVQRSSVICFYRRRQSAV